jgi:cyclopropane fatty-acyl-phospholipid synthase-like methyltransferase
MSRGERDYFASKAADYDSERRRVENVDRIARKIVQSIPLERNMHIADFGSGTGLLLRRIAPYVGKISAIDRSESMNEVLRKNLEEIECPVVMIEKDIEREPIEGEFDAIVSSMTIHHIADIERLFRIFHSLLREGGYIALADLDREDGSFHTIDTGVCHYGFEREELKRIARRSGFDDLRVCDASVVEKPYGSYPVFLLTGVKTVISEDK